MLGSRDPEDGGGLFARNMAPSYMAIRRENSTTNFDV